MFNLVKAENFKLFDNVLRFNVVYFEALSQLHGVLRSFIAAAWRGYLILALAVTSPLRVCQVQARQLLLALCVKGEAFSPLGTLIGGLKALRNIIPVYKHYYDTKTYRVICFDYFQRQHSLYLFLNIILVSILNNSKQKCYLNTSVIYLSRLLGQ